MTANLQTLIRRKLCQHSSSLGILSPIMRGKKPNKVIIYDADCRVSIAEGLFSGKSND